MAITLAVHFLLVIVTKLVDTLAIITATVFYASRISCNPFLLAIVDASPIISTYARVTNIPRLGFTSHVKLSANTLSFFFLWHIWVACINGF